PDARLPVSVGIDGDDGGGWVPAEQLVRLIRPRCSRRAYPGGPQHARQFSNCTVMPVASRDPPPAYLILFTNRWKRARPACPSRRRTNCGASACSKCSTNTALGR